MMDGLYHNIIQKTIMITYTGEGASMRKHTPFRIALAIL